MLLLGSLQNAGQPPGSNGRTMSKIENSRSSFFHVGRSDASHTDVWPSCWSTRTRTKPETIVRKRPVICYESR